jgi:hypothetical protein
MIHKLAILGVVVVLSLATSAWSQNPVTMDSPFQIRYMANLNIGDAFVNMTNSGANGAPLLGPGFGSPVGNICVNAYVFSPDEQLISCCSCLITPNGLKTLSARNDLINNTLTPAVPNAVTVKLLSTLAGTGGSGTSCSNSAATVTTATIVQGLVAWGTTLHPQVVYTSSPNMSTKCVNHQCSTYPNTAYCQTYCKPIVTATTAGYSTTETPFTPATLSAGELASIGGRCATILGNGSGFGICGSCDQGAQ